MTWTHFRDVIGKSRRDRVCCLCGRTIAAAATRVTRVGVDDREFVRMDMHLACEARTGDWSQMDWECHSPGDGDWPDLEEATS